MTSLQTQLNVGRAKNVLQDYFVRKLLIPKIYLDADWTGQHVDVLAIDRSGVGDVHAIRIFPLESELGASIRAAFVLFANPSLSGIEKFTSLPSHFRYIALVGDDPDARKINFANEIIPPLFAEDGVGRVGILYVNPSEYEPTVQVISKAERFRSSKEIVERADRFVAEHTPNWQIPDDERI